VNHQVIFGVFLMMGSAIVFVSTLLIHAIGLHLPLKQAVAPGRPTSFQRLKRERAQVARRAAIAPLST
jgi:hypothetical protein